MIQVGTIERMEYLEPSAVDQVLALADLAGTADGAYPLSEHVVLHLRHGGDAPAVHLVIREPTGTIVGYAHLDPTDVVAGPSAELVVHPLKRRAGLGRTLVRGALTVAAEHDPAGRLRLWAHGDHPSANALANSLGFHRARVLWQMRRSLFAPMPPVVLPDDVTIRAFVPGRDDEPWLALNAKAFAAHPEQGRWTMGDLRVRMAEPWFDSAGFLLAERDGRLLGFHWTKIHGELPHRGHEERPHQHDPIGEVYVLGVDPDAHTSGLGGALTVEGLRHLRRSGLEQVMLYVDESNVPAIGLYTKLGFVRWSTDVSFARS